MTEEGSVSLIMDTGSWACRAGLSNEDFPRVSWPTAASAYKSINKENNMVMYFGREAFEKQATMGLQSLIRDGKVDDWELMENFWQSLVSKNFPSDSAERPFLTNFYPNANKFTKEKMTQIFFESFNVPSYFAVSNSLLVLYSSGRVTGLVLDSGHGVTSAVPVIDGSPLYAAQATSSFGGKTITDYLLKSTSLNDRELSREVKEKYCRVSSDFEREVTDLLAAPGQNMITLPDGSAFDLKAHPLTATEGLFRPEVIDSVVPSVQELVYSACMKSEQDLRRDLMSNVVVSGGNTCFPNFNERLQKELLMLVPSYLKVKCVSFADKVNSAWFGGAIVSSLGSFQPMWVTRSEYEECGPSIINRKCI